MNGLVPALVVRRLLAVTLILGLFALAFLGSRGSYDNPAPRVALETRGFVSLAAIRAPPARLASAMVYAQQSGRIVLFGGFTEARSVLGDTWTYDLNNRTWRNANPANSPPPRSDPSLAYDSGSDKVVLFGGVTKTDGETGYVDLNDTWVYDVRTNGWQNLGPANAPGPRHGHRMVYDSIADRIIMVGGHACSYVPSPVCTLFGDTWSYDYDHNAWTNRVPANGFSTTNFFGFAYDAESDRAILDGGDGTTADQTWAYDFGNNMWTDVTPVNRPSPRAGHATAYDAISDQVILFGGGDSETWAYDFNHLSWTNRNTAGAPSARYFHAMAYDSRSDRVVMFGG